MAGHLSVGQLFERYRRADDAVVKAHLQVIRQKAQGRSTGEVARKTGFKVDWVRRVVHRYNGDGPDSLGGPTPGQRQGATVVGGAATGAAVGALETGA